MPKTFLISDESINCYGVRIIAAGLAVDAFLRNPVMLFMHERGRVVGKWTNLRREDGSWLADAEFDMDDPEAAKLAGKVERDFIRAASLSAEVKEAVWNEDLVCYDATKTILQEISIVDIGGNSNALRLCDNSGQVLSEDQVKAQLLQLSNQLKPFNTTSPKMDEKAIKLACGLPETATEQEVTQKIIQLNAGGDYKTKFEALEKQIIETKNQEASRLIDKAVADHRIQATEKDAFLKLFALDFENTKLVLESRTAPQNLVALANAGAQQFQTAQTTEDAVKLYNELDKSGKLIKLKAENPAEFTRLFKAKFGKEPSK